MAAYRIIRICMTNSRLSYFILGQYEAGRQDKWSLAAPVLKIMLPKSLDGDSAKGGVIPTPPVPNMAEALFNELPEHRSV